MSERGKITDGMSEEDLNARHAEKMAKKKVAREKIMATKTGEKGLVIVHTGKGKGKSSVRRKGSVVLMTYYCALKSLSGVCAISSAYIASTLSPYSCALSSTRAPRTPAFQQRAIA